MIKSIFVAKKSKMPQIGIEAVKVDAGKGIVGDRSYGKRQEAGQNITFVESEEIEAFNTNFDQQIGQSATRRNIVTEGIRLNNLVGKEFMIGDVRFYGVELCEPCAYLGQLLANDSLSAPQVVKAWLHRGGLRADVLSTGILKTGMPFILREE
ncbi:MOSC domain protein [Marinomonas spartinae]|uniref:MOSC domain protein n=1 Tax=Marinomonas spartinae TaxID=1792290 RepID=A0A1A8TPB9_9GAMM|nr:MOSC domain-containing protein [Marinomonas spartinae]SBS32969.1 MOSC domain protein [Marinomonas spartinae]SBS35747.1 MOSC domain protein [Marinomonas spartinae]